MNYPVWEVYFAGGGALIALIAVVHVYIAQFAVGGGLFLVLTEIKAGREDSPAMFGYVKKHAGFFLLLTMVLGGMTGVGIWFTISLYSPAATSVLIHYFVFGWAAEWVCFFAEIVALFLYYYHFSRLDRRSHLILGWLYFVFAWLSLFLVNGIIAFMLTPGRWLETGNFWQGFFNPGMWPSLCFRTVLSLMLAGVYGFVTVVFIKDKDFREKMVKYCAKWLLLPFLLLILFSLWYLKALPMEVRARILEHSPEIAVYGRAFVLLLAVMFSGGLLMAIRMPGAVKKPLAFAMLVIALFYVGSFEFIREAGRRPYLIYNYMYSNAIAVDRQADINSRGVLKTARWTRCDRVTEENKREAGREIFRLECLSCHCVGGPLNDILPLTAGLPVFGIDAHLDGLGKISGYMPPFMGTKKERRALAEYIAAGLHGRSPSPRQAPEIRKEEATVPPFDPAGDDYVLLAWSGLGAHFFSDCSDYWVLRPPGSDLFAQLIRRGPLPEVVTEGVRVRYRVQPGFENPAARMAFWENVGSVFGKNLPDNTGLAGKGLAGVMEGSDSPGAYVAERVPAAPYPEKSGYLPYPLFYITAEEEASGRVLAVTTMAAPASTEMGCRRCHGGKWRVDGTAGVSAATAGRILKTHDENEDTDLWQAAEQGRPVRCRDCHIGFQKSRKEEKASSKALSLSAAIHGRHAHYLTRRGEKACLSCHPASASGPSGSLRGIHQKIGLDCTACHGAMADHALSLLKQERSAGRDVRHLMTHLKPQTADSVARINPRWPWVQQPDCLNCHIDYRQPETFSAFNTWTASGNDLFRMRREETDRIMCQACHGAAHALYPTENIYGKNRDNLPALQHQKTPLPIAANRNCAVCHTMDMGMDMHHPNIYRDFRNSWVLVK